MIGTPEQDAFISKSRWAVVTSLRKDGSPSNSVVFYARDGDELLFSTTSSRLKAKTLRSDARAAITVLDEGPPFGYVTVEGTATIQEDNLVPFHITLNRAMRGEPNWQPPEGFEARLRSEGRVVVHITATRVSGVTNRG